MDTYDDTNARVDDVCIAKIEAHVGRTIRRDISRLVGAAQGNIEKAAQSILDCERPHICIVAGFFIRYAEPPSAETDGLMGTAHLAAAFSKLGYRVTVITDAPCAKAMWATLTEVPFAIRLEVVGVDREQVLELRSRLQSMKNPPTHFIAIERASPGSDGKPHREHGWDMSEESAPLDLLFYEDGWKAPWLTIGIGDGGNEIGMGSLPAEIVENDIPNGALIASTTPCDFLIVASVANWGAYALIGAMARLDNQLKEDLFDQFTGEMEERYLRAAVELGQAIDDSRLDQPGKPQMTCDRLPLADHVAIIEEIREFVDTVGREVA